ncbi:MAG: hypothetical protein IH905_08615, partial [Proteobacteria bacterium]|nr:hypothetical protein [Pseudomonadota bacterium]
MLAEQIVNGLVVGGMYALIALGFTLVFGLLDKLNFAHGEVVTLAGFIAIFSMKMGLSFLRGVSIFFVRRWPVSVWTTLSPWYSSMRSNSSSICSSNISVFPGSFSLACRISTISKGCSGPP